MQIKPYLKKNLLTLGLTDGEASVYLLILEYPDVDAAFVRLKTGFSSSGVYKIINTLVDKGFITPSNAKAPVKFEALPFDQLAKFFSSQGRKLQRVSSKLNEFARLAKLPNGIEVYEDDDLTDFYLNIPSKIDDFLWCIGSFEAVINFFGPEIEKDFITMRNKKGKPADALIFDNSEYSKELAGRDVLEKRETKLVTYKDYPLEFSYLFGNTYLNFYKDAEGKLKVLKSESPELARSKQIQFQMLWNSTV